MEVTLKGSVTRFKVVAIWPQDTYPIKLLILNTGSRSACKPGAINWEGAEIRGGGGAAYTITKWDGTYFTLTPRGGYPIRIDLIALAAMIERAPSAPSAPVCTCNLLLGGHTCGMQNSDLFGALH